MLGFDVCFCLFVAVCSAVAAVSWCVRMLCLYSAHAGHVCHVCGANPQKGNKTIDKVRVNGSVSVVPLICLYA